MGNVKPTIRLRRLGLALKRAREEAGLTLEEAADVLLRHYSSISRIEKGLHHTPVRDVEYMLDKYGVTDELLRAHLFELSRNGRKKGWWQKYKSDISHEMMDFISLEADAASIEFFELILVPGLLQTEEYARALMSRGPFGGDPEKVDRLVDIRMRRQEIIARPNPPRLWAIVDEAVLHRKVGGPETMRAQLRRLARATELPNLTLQVLPFRAGAYQGMTGAFKILAIREPGDLQVVTADSLTEISYREREDEIRAYSIAFDHLREASLSQADSQALIERLLSGP